jgi:inorganic triphosphatase YgiF
MFDRDGDRTARECEIKLEGPPSALRAAAQRLGLADAPARAMRAIYYDTPERALEQARVSLRARRAGGGWTTTLKWPQPGEGIFSHGETEAPGGAPQGDAPPALDALDAPARQALREIADEGALAPRFETRVRRRTKMLEREGARIEAALDAGSIAAGARRARIAEIELEWKGGPPEGFYVLARELIEAGLRIAPLAKSARGYLLAADEEPREARAAPPPLSARSSAEDALIALVEGALAQFVMSLPALRTAYAAEAVHQMRVALRRLRAGLALFDRLAPDAGLRRFRDDAQRLARALGPARELDVFLEGLREEPFAAAGAQAGLKDLRARASRKRTQAHAQARALAQGAQASLFVIDLQAFAAARGWRADPLAQDWARENARAFARQRLADLDKRAHKRGGKLRKLDPPRRHRLRIALKTLRYAAEMFEPAFAPDDLRGVLKPATRLLERLGRYNDAVAAAARARSLGAGAQGELARAIGVAQGWALHDAHAGDDSLRKAFKRFRDAPRPWA